MQVPKTEREMKREMIVAMACFPVPTRTEPSVPSLPTGEEKDQKERPVVPVVSDVSTSPLSHSSRDVAYFKDRSIEERIGKCGYRNLRHLCEAAMGDEDLSTRLSSQRLFLHHRVTEAQWWIFVLCEGSIPRSLETKDDARLMCLLMEHFVDSLDLNKDVERNQLRKAHNVLTDICSTAQVSWDVELRVLFLESVLANSYGRKRGGGGEEVRRLFPQGAKAEAHFLGDGLFLLNGHVYHESSGFTEREYRRFLRELKQWNEQHIA